MNLVRGQKDYQTVAKDVNANAGTMGEGRVPLVCCRQNQSRRRPSPDAAVVFLKRKGVRVMAGRVLIQAGVRAGMKVDYFLGRLGNQLEFVQF